MKVQWKSGRPRRRWLDRLRDDIKEKGLSADELYDRATWRRTPTRHKCGNKTKKNASEVARHGLPLACDAANGAKLRE